MYKFKSIIILLCLLAVAGCSTLGRIEEVVVSPDDIENINHHNATVDVDVIGGDRRFVSSDLFKTALVESLEKANIFTSAKDTENAQYELFVIILRSEQSGLGGSYLINSKWILHKSSKEIWTEIVVGNGDSMIFGGHARLRASAERASKDNIRNGIKMIGDLSLEKI